MRKATFLASLLATGSILALATLPAAAQVYDATPFGPIGDIFTAPVAAAGQIVDAPFAAVNGVSTPIVQSNRTAAFVANADANVNFINDASRMALDRSANPALRRIAHRLAVEQTIAGNSMTAWADTNPPLLTGRSAYVGDPIIGLTTLPINVIVGVGNSVTGGNIVASSDGRALLRSQTVDLSRLTAANGASFDGLYRDTQLDALRQLATLYGDYAVNGDDPGLRNLARAELPKVRMRISEFNRI